MHNWQGAHQELLCSLSFLLRCRDKSTVPRFLKFQHCMYSKADRPACPVSGFTMPDRNLIWSLEFCWGQIYACQQTVRLWLLPDRSVGAEKALHVASCNRALQCSKFHGNISSSPWRNKGGLSHRFVMTGSQCNLACIHCLLKTHTLTIQGTHTPSLPSLQQVIPSSSLVLPAVISAQPLPHIYIQLLFTSKLIQQAACLFKIPTKVALPPAVSKSPYR